MYNGIDYKTGIPLIFIEISNIFPEIKNKKLYS